MAQGSTAEVAELALNSLPGAIMGLSTLEFLSLIFRIMWILSVCRPLRSDHIHLRVCLQSKPLNTAAGLLPQEEQGHATSFSFRYYTFQPPIIYIGEPATRQK